MLDLLAPLFSLALGLLAGFSSLLPFLHANTLIALFAEFFQEPVLASVFIVSLAASNFVFSCFPAVFFGVPSTSQSVSVLPSHGLVLHGRGPAALKTMLHAIFLSLVVSLLLSPFFAIASSAVYALARPLTLVALIVILAFFFASESGWRNRLLGGAVFCVSGALGFVVLGLPITRAPLLPLLTGLFGLPILLASLSATTPIPSQREEAIQLPLRNILVGVSLGLASVFLPALSPAFLASAVFLVVREGDSLSFISLSTAIAASKLVFDLQAVFSFGKARSGFAAAVLSRHAELLPSMNWLLLLALSVACVVSLFILLSIHSWLINLLKNAPQQRVSFTVLLAILAGVLFSSGPSAIAVLVVAGAVGLLPSLLKIRLAYSMGALIMPTLLYYSGLHFTLTSIIYSS